MRQETNKEIDLLLRRMSRRDGEAARGAEKQIEDRHLDADELSSYAQNVLPPAARARYMEHLVECSTCRRLATELSLALGGATVAAPVETVSPASGLKKFLASLFTPMVLRYAVPALGVILVMVIGFVVLRQRGAHDEFVSQIATQPIPNARPEQTAAVPPVEQQNRQEETRAGVKAANEAPPSREGESGRTAGGGAETKAEESKTAATADAAAAAPVAPVTVATPSDVQPYTSRSVSELPLVKSTPPPPAAPKAGITTDGIDDTKSKKEVVAERDAKQAPQTADLQAASEKKQANEPARVNDNERPARKFGADRAEQNKARAGARTDGGAGAGRTVTRGNREDSKDEAETRSIAGRKFRKERGIWTDTAYDSSTGTINMGRGSEQFRSLVADEPAIKTIAEQLDGEVIVVWKGRSYRIR